MQLPCTYPRSTEVIIQAFESVAAHWNTHPTPFDWAGRRKARRDRAALKRHRLGASGAATIRPPRRRFLSRCAWQPTHRGSLGTRPAKTVRYNDLWWK